MSSESKLSPRPESNDDRSGAYYPYLFRLMHWPLGASMIVLILTGLSQHAISAPGWSLFSGVVPSFFWQGRVHLIHTLASLVFFPALIAVSLIYVGRHVKVCGTHVVLLVGGLAVAVSGVILMSWPGPTVVYWIARWTHAVGGLVVSIGFLWHVLTRLTVYRRALVPAFHPWAQARWLSFVWFVPVVLVTTCLLLSGLPVHPPNRDLVARKISAANVPTEDLDKLPWDQAKPLQVALANGAGFSHGRTQVTLQALYDDRELFVRAEWPDPSEDRRYMPWVKTSDGWKHLVTNADDESHYYEDKFSLIFPIEPDWQFERFGCALYCHAGGGRAYGYKGSKRIVDVWHWKSTRTDPVGQVDDKHWSAVKFEPEDPKYKDIGRHADPKESGGYSKNLSDDKKSPKVLPREPWKAHHGIVPAEDAVPFDSEEAAETAAKIPVGGIVPGIIASPAVGDRGDVSCISKHEDGRWVVHLRRKLDTERKLDDGRLSDVTFVPGSAHAFGCAAFDNTSKRHAYGLTPFRLVLEE